jgi:taurine dioxygenase
MWISGGLLMKIRPVSLALGAEVSGLRLNQPLHADDVCELYDAWLRYQVLVFHDQDMSDEDQRRFTDYFGEAQNLTRTASALRSAAPNVMYIGNVTIGDIRGDLPHGDMQFHTDGAYFERPTKATVLYGIHTPTSGGDTLFSNGYKAFESLPADLRRRIVGLSALNVYDYGSGGTARNLAPSPDATRCVHPVVTVHPETRRSSLYVNRLMTLEIVGKERSESDPLLEILFQATERPEFIYAHKWQPRDLVVWDNRCTFHARTDFDPREKRALRRMTTKGERPVGATATV